MRVNIRANEEKTVTLLWVNVAEFTLYRGTGVDCYRVIV